MTRRLLAGYLTIAVFVLLVLEIPLGLTYARTELERLRVAVERDARVVVTLVEDQLEHATEGVALPASVLSYTSAASARVLVVDTDGRSVADTEPGVPVGRDYGTRPEIVQALAGGIATGSRWSETLGIDVSYVAVPAAHEGHILGAVRITYATGEVDERIARNWTQLGLMAVGVLTVTAAVGVALSRSVTRPLGRVRDAARDIAAGSLATRAVVDSGPPEVRQLAAEFNRMADRIEGLVATQQAFVSDASHQLRSPLTSLRLELEMLESEVAGTAADDQRVQRALDGVDRLGRIVSGLLTLSRADRAPVDTRQVDLAGLARERVEAWAPVAADTGHDLHAEAPGQLPVQSVADWLEQVVDNLVDNALRAAPPGTVVTIRTTTADGHAVLEVVDHGPGLDEDAKRRAFDRFWRGQAEEAGTGTGLGLPIARQLTEAAGGRLELQDTPGGGLTARLSLPTDPAG